MTEVKNVQADEFEKQYPTEKYKKQVFTFSREELGIINTYHTIKTMGELSGILINNLINGTVLPRIGIAPRKGIGTIYNNAEGIITVYTPLHWCEGCKSEVSEYSFDGKKYCATCLSLAKTKKEVETGGEK